VAAIAGFTVANDVSVRDWQRRTTEFLQGKTFERTTPIGPWLTTADEVGGARPDLEVRGTVEGEIRQQARTSDLVFDPVHIVRDGAAQRVPRAALEPADEQAPAPHVAGTPGDQGTLGPRCGEQRDVAGHPHEVEGPAEVEGRAARAPPLELRRPGPGRGDHRR